jgi:hypothetical protein
MYAMLRRPDCLRSLTHGMRWKRERVNHDFTTKMKSRLRQQLRASLITLLHPRLHLLGRELLTRQRDNVYFCSQCWFRTHALHCDIAMPCLCILIGARPLVLNPNAYRDLGSGRRRASEVVPRPKPAARYGAPCPEAACPCRYLAGLLCTPQSRVVVDVLRHSCKLPSEEVTQWPRR